MQRVYLINKIISAIDIKFNLQETHELRICTLDVSLVTSGQEAFYTQAG
jgi:hypothetical protein